MQEHNLNLGNLSNHKQTPSNVESMQNCLEGRNKRHEKCKLGHGECSPCKKKISDAQFDGIVERLYTCWRMYKDRMEKRKYKYEEDLLETNTFKPEISENSKSIINELHRKHHNDEAAAKYLPIYKEKRLKEIENHKKLKMERIKEELMQRELKLKQEEDEILRLVAAKTDSRKYNEKEFLENIEVKFNAYLQKKKQEREEHDAQYSDITFTPVISSKSKNIMKNKCGAKTFRERQKEYQDKNAERKKKLEQQLIPSFKPTLNPRSKKLHKRMKSDATLKTRNSNRESAAKSYDNVQVRSQFKYNELPKRIAEEIQEVEEDSSNIFSMNNQIN